MMLTNAELYTRVMNIMNPQNFDKSIRPVADVGQVWSNGRNPVNAHHAHLAGDLRDRDIGQAALHVLEQEDRLVLEGDETVLAEGIGGYDVVRVTRIEVKLVSKRIVVRELQHVRRSQPVLAFDINYACVQVILLR